MSQRLGTSSHAACHTIGLLFTILCAITTTAGAQPPATITLREGDLAVTFRDNSDSPRLLSGIDQLFHVSAAPDFDAFDPDSVGASAGLNFEHIISGHASPNNRFTPRAGLYTLSRRTGQSAVRLTRRAEDSPWRVSSEFTYTLNPPHYVDFDFRCQPEEAERFGARGYAIFFFANYMNDVADLSLNFRGKRSQDAPEEWIVASAPDEHPDWNQGGTYRAEDAAALAYDADVDFRLNTWSYDWPRITIPFYYGLAKNNMTMILMFDRLSQPRDQIRFSLFKFKTKQFPRPAWDFQYVINRVETGQEYGFRGRLVWKPFVSADDCWLEYRRWSGMLTDE